jgi:hypothetical protein
VCRIGLRIAWNVQLLVGEIANARREPVAEPVHESEHMIGEASGIRDLEFQSGVALWEVYHD